jgi:hypothetical protein
MKVYSLGPEGGWRHGINYKMKPTIANGNLARFPFCGVRWDGFGFSMFGFRKGGLQFPIGWIEQFTILWVTMSILIILIAILGEQVSSISLPANPSGLQSEPFAHTARPGITGAARPGGPDDDRLHGGRPGGTAIGIGRALIKLQATSRLARVLWRQRHSLVQHFASSIQSDCGLPSSVDEKSFALAGPGRDWCHRFL